MIQPGSYAAIKAQAGKTFNEFVKLVDEILHTLDFIDVIGNAKWHYRYCKWSHERGEE